MGGKNVWLQAGTRQWYRVAICKNGRVRLRGWLAMPVVISVAIHTTAPTRNG